MKTIGKFFSFVAVGAVLCAVMLCASACAKDGKGVPAPEGKTLVAYFSASGVTRGLAGHVAEVTGGDLFEIVPEQPYTEADLNWKDENSRSSVEMKKDRSIRPAIKSKVADMSAYGTIYVGFPIWWYIAPTIINTFLESYDLKGKRVITFATSGGSGWGKTLENLKPSAPDALWVEGKVLNRADREDVRKWVDSLNR